MGHLMRDHPHIATRKNQAASRRAMVENRAVCQLVCVGGHVVGGEAGLSPVLTEERHPSYETDDLKTSADRISHFGQKDHVRYYGGDLRDRIHAAGFTVTEFTAQEPDVHTYGLLRGEKIFIATRPSQANKELQHGPV